MFMLSVTVQTIPHPLLSQEFQVLGCQLLTQLRDVIECPADDVIAGDFSQCPDLPTDLKAKVTRTMTSYGGWPCNVTLVCQVLL